MHMQWHTKLLRIVGLKMHYQHRFVFRKIIFLYMKVEGVVTTHPVPLVPIPMISM